MTEDEQSAFADAFSEALQNECSQCMTRARNNYAICMAQAGSDEPAKRRCSERLQNDVQNCNNGPCRV